MAGPSLIDRLKASRLVQVLLLYLGASWVIIEVAGELQEALELPDWLVPVALVLLLVGLLVVLATAWVQGNPATDAREAAGEVPDSWEVGVGDFFGDIRRGRFPHLTWGRAILGGVFALALLFGVTGAYVLVQGGSGLRTFDELAAEEAGAGLAIVPFSVSGLDAEIYGEGMVTLLGTTLDGVPGLRVVDSRTVLARWDDRVSGDSRPDLPAILDVARRSGAVYVLVGDAVSTGVGVRLAADLYDARSGERLGAARAEGPADSLPSLVDELSVGTAGLLLSEREDSAELAHLSSITTSSLDALLAYVEGERAYRRGAWEESYGAYARAIELDSTFALAHLRAAQAAGWEGSLGNRADRRAHRTAAAKHIDKLPPRERALLAGLRGVANLEVDQIEAAEAAVRRYPDDPELWNVLGELLVHVGQKAFRSPDEAVEPLERALELAPGTGPYAIHLTDHALAYGDSADAADAVERESSLIPELARAREALLSLAHGDSASGRAALTTLIEDELGGQYVNALRGLRRMPELQVYREIRSAAYPQSRSASAELADVLAKRGRLRASLDVLDPTSVEATMFRLGMYELDLMPFDSVRSLNLDGLPPPARAFAAAALEDRQGFAAARDAALASLEEFLQANPALRDDPLGPAGFAPLLDAVGVRMNVGPDSALPLFLDLVQGMPANAIDGTYFEIGEMYEETGDERNALRYFLAAGQTNPYAALRAARLADRLGQPDVARRLYQELLIAWEGADPQLEPWLEEARGWLERVPG